MAKEPLATKYRPRVFSDVCEQSAVCDILQEQLRTDSFQHAYLFTGPAGTGKTTLGRLFANEVNKGQGNPIEVDAASNSGVDNIRVIIEDSRKRSLDSEYKIYIIDECVEGKTEILTNKGWKRIDSISENEIVAQYTDEGKIEFVPIEEYIVKEYRGDMYKVSFRNGKKSVLMSPHHVQPVRIKNSKKILENYIEDCKFAQTNEIIVSGEGTGNNELLTSMERLYLACQADGYCGVNNLWELHLGKQEKINRALDLLDDCQIEYKIYGGTNYSIRFYCDFPKTKKLKDYFAIDMGVDRAKDFISEILLWDGSIKSGYPGYYSCTDKDNVDFVSAILAQCGYSGNQNITHYENPNHNDIYSINWYYRDARPSTAVSKEKIEGYNGNIYCVKVPSHKIVLRADGFTFISGNCHSLSSGAWQALLKTLEEAPKYSIFILCTTDPQKIPATIISRVQRYQLSKISTEGIYKRLLYICEQEKITIDEKAKESIQFIARISQGGMRDAITALDKCISTGEPLTLELVVNSLGNVEYDTQFELFDSIYNSDVKKSVEIVEKLFDSGKSLKVFVKQFQSFLVDICKYKIFNSFEYSQIPSMPIYVDKVQNYDKTRCVQILDTIKQFNSAVKWESDVKYSLETLLLTMENNDDRSN